MPTPPPVLPITSTYAVTAEILVGWDTPPKITHPFAPTNGSLDASISGVKFTTIETQRDADNALISTDTYYSTRTRPIGGEFLYTIAGLGRGSLPSFDPASSAPRPDMGPSPLSSLSSLNGIKLDATQKSDGSFPPIGHLVTATFTPDPEKIDISAEVLTPKQIANGQTYNVSLEEVSTYKYIQVYKGDPRLRWEPTKTYFYLMGDPAEYSRNAKSERDAAGSISYYPFIYADEVNGVRDRIPKSELVQEMGVRNETSVEARFTSGDGNYWSWDDEGLFLEPFGWEERWPSKYIVTFTTF